MDTSEPASARRILLDPLLIAFVALTGLVFGMPALKPLFAAMFPGLDRPLYEQDSFCNLTMALLGLGAASSAICTFIP